MRARRSAPFLPRAFLLLMAVSLALLAETAFAEPALAAAGSRPIGLEEARALLARASTPAESAALLDSLSSELEPSEALALLSQGLASLGPEYRKPLLAKAGDFSLLLGAFGDAASRYEAAAAIAPADKGLLLRAARCRLAAGDAEAALDLSSGLILAADDAAMSSAARLVGAWALALQGRRDDAGSVAASLAGSASAPAEQRREARFLMWLCAGAEERPKAAATLAAEFPGSPEALISSGAALAPPLPHWYLGGLGLIGDSGAGAPRGAQPASARVAGSSPAPSPAATGPGAGPGSGARGKRLQVGYFSVADNARALMEELSSKGFASSLEERERAPKPGDAPLRRWIVSVEGGTDIARTMQALKEAGYESYMID